MRCKNCYHRLVCKKIVPVGGDCYDYLDDSKININENKKELLGISMDGLTFNNGLITRFLNYSKYKLKT